VTAANSQMGNAMPADVLSDERYCWFVTVANRTIIPTDPMTAIRSTKWRDAAQAMLEAGFFLAVDLMMLEEDGETWVMYDEKRDREIQNAGK
jgi:hypothetical protein